jgi:hypothetical protein
MFYKLSYLIFVSFHRAALVDVQLTRHAYSVEYLVQDVTVCYVIKVEQESL